MIAEPVHPTTNPCRDLLGVGDASVGEGALAFAQELLAALDPKDRGHATIAHAAGAVLAHEFVARRTPLDGWEHGAPGAKAREAFADLLESFVHPGLMHGFLYTLVAERERAVRAFGTSSEAWGYDLCAGLFDAGTGGFAYADPLTAQFDQCAHGVGHGLYLARRTCGEYGPVGAGAATKSINNVLNSAHLLLATEGMLALKSYGVSPATALEAINGGSGMSLQTTRLPDNVLSRKFSYGFALGLMVEALTSALGGFGRKDGPTQHGASVTLLLFDPEAFGGREDFTAESSFLAAACRAANVPEGATQVRIPGARGLDARRKALAEGVALYPGIMERLAEWAERLGVEVPDPLN